MDMSERKKRFYLFALSISLYFITMIASIGIDAFLPISLIFLWLAIYTFFVTVFTKKNLSDRKAIIINRIKLISVLYYLFAIGVIFSFFSIASPIGGPILFVIIPIVLIVLYIIAALLISKINKNTIYVLLTIILIQGGNALYTIISGGLESQIQHTVLTPSRIYVQTFIPTLFALLLLIFTWYFFIQLDKAKGKNQPPPTSGF